jgi:hypothetical protein
VLEQARQSGGKREATETSRKRAAIDIHAARLLKQRQNV